MDGKGVGKLLPKRLRKKAKDSKNAGGSGASTPSGSLTPETSSTGAISRTKSNNDLAAAAAAATAGENLLATNSSDGTNSVVNMAEAEDGSFVSYESEPELSRPQTISAHPSQIGHLTTSSPLVQAAHLADSDLADEDHRLTSSNKSLSFPAARSPSRGPDQDGRSRTQLAPSPSRNRRSPSPVGRIREIFAAKRAGPGDLGDSVDEGGADNSVELSDGFEAKPSAAGRERASSKASSLEQRRPRAPSIPLDVTIPPRTPPSADLSAAPQIINTPPTPTASNTPELRASSPRKPESGSGASSPTKPANGLPSTASTPGNMSGNRRSRSGSASIVPSKLSNSVLAPVTPIVEAGPVTPGGTSNSGFFSSMLSAAQNAANTLSNSIQNSNLAPGPGNKKGASSRNLLQDIANLETGSDDQVTVEASMDQKELAVKTLGTGELSLSQLGLADPSSAPEAGPPRGSEPPELRPKADGPEPAAGPSADPAADDSQLSRPRSVYEPAGNGELTPPAQSLYEEKPGITRSGSIRSAIGRRRRGGSGTTGVTTATTGTGGSAGTTIGAAIAAANSSLAQPAANSGRKLTGFAIASKKRNRDFHTLFKSVPDDDFLIEDYSCALQREILAHGRLYVSEGHLCFSSNIFGWVTTLVMSFDEIISVEKRSTALVFRNGLMISTLHAKHIFASFTSRDATYDLIVNIWKLGHPSLQSTLNGVKLEGTGGDKTEKIDIERPAAPEADELDDLSGSDESDDEDIYDEDDEEDMRESTQATELTVVDAEIEKAVTRKASGMVKLNALAAEEPKEPMPAAAGGAQDFPGPATHAPTDCGDAATHYDRVVGDDVIPAPLGKVYSMLFGPQSVAWLSKWLTNEQKCMDLQMEDKKGLTPDNKTRGYTFIKPLSGSIGPKQTKCIISETLDNYDLDKAVNISSTTQNPDVPSGNIFSVKTKYCLSWAENNATRVQVNVTIEWTGKSWLRGPIEKGANDGQAQYCKDIFASLKAALSTRPRSGTASNGAAKKGKKSSRKGKAAQSQADAGDAAGAAKSAAKQNWGMLEPVRGFVEPLVDIVKPLMTGNVMYGLLVGLLVASWFGFGFNRPSVRRFGGDVMGFQSFPDRIAAYEEMWRREDSDLWDWLEDRVGLERLGKDDYPVVGRKKATEPRSVEEKLREERMDEREMQEAIRVTESKLEVLKDVVGKRKGGQ